MSAAPTSGRPQEARALDHPLTQDDTFGSDARSTLFVDLAEHSLCVDCRFPRLFAVQPRATRVREGSAPAARVICSGRRAAALRPDSLVLWTIRPWRETPDGSLRPLERAGTSAPIDERTLTATPVCALAV